MKLLIGGKNRNIYMRKDGSAYYKSGGENVDVTHMFKKNGGGLKKQYIGGVQNNLGKVERTKRLKRKNKLFLGGTITFGAITVDSQKLRKVDGSFFELSDFTTGDAGVIKDNFTKVENACDEMIRLCQIYMNYIHERFNNIDNDENHVSELQKPIYQNRDLTKLQVLNIIDAAFLLDELHDLGDKNKVIKMTYESSNFDQSVFLDTMKTRNERARIIENEQAKEVDFEFYDMIEGKKIITGSIYQCYPNQLFYYSRIIYYLCNNIGSSKTGINNNIIVFIKHVYESLFEKAKIGKTQEKTQTEEKTQTDLAPPGQQAAASTAAPAADHEAHEAAKN